MKFEAINFERDPNPYGWGVKVHSEEDGRDYWFDISLSNGDLDGDWNQYIFDLTDSDDIERKKFQETSFGFESIMEEAIDYLISQGELDQAKDGQWFCPISEENFKKNLK